MSDQAATPPNPDDIPSWVEQTGAQEKAFDALQDIPGARTDLIRGEPMAATARLGIREPEIDPDSPDTLRACLAWGIMHAEAAIMLGEFGAARQFCQNGLERISNSVRRIGPITRPLLNDGALFEAIFITLGAEAERRQGPLSKETITSLQRLAHQLGPHMYESGLDDRFKFVIYVASRTLGHDLELRGVIGELPRARGHLETAGPAKAIYMNVEGRLGPWAKPTPRETPRHAVMGPDAPGKDAREQREREEQIHLWNPDVSPVYAEVMHLPYASL